MTTRVDDSPTLGVLVISYHQEHYLADALKSVKQSFDENDEIVVAVLDATATSIELAQRILEDAAISARLIVFDNPPFTSVRVLQDVLPQMRCANVVLLAADDALTTGYKSAILENVSNVTLPVVLNSRLILADENLTAVGNADPRWTSCEWLNRLWLFYENPGKAPGSVIPRRAVLDSQFMKVDPRCLIEDYPLWLLLSGRAQFRRVRRSIVRYRQHQNSLSKKAQDRNLCWSIGYCVGLAEARAGNFFEHLLVRLGRRRWYRQTDPSMRQYVEQGRRCAAIRFG